MLEGMFRMVGSAVEVNVGAPTGLSAADKGRFVYSVVSALKKSATGC